MAEDLTGAYELLQVMPRVGLGAFSLDSETLSVQRLSGFFQNGGRLLEVSELFSNYQYIWPALHNVHLSREDIFVIVRIWPQQQTPADLQDRVEKFLAASHLAYIDILVAHAPIDMSNRFEQWNALESVKRRGLTRTLGLANMSLNQIMTVIKNANILPAFFVTELSPFKQQKELVEYCNAGSLMLVNAEPCCKGIRNRSPKLVELSQQLSMTPEQILFLWSLGKGCITLLPAGNKKLGLNPTFYAEQALPEDVMALLDSWDEDLSTAWAPAVDEDN